MEWALLALALALTAAQSVFVAAEFSLVAVDRHQVAKRAGEGDRRSNEVLEATRTLSTQLSGAQLGITITTLVVGFIAEPSLAQLVDGPLEGLGLPERGADAVAITLALLLATILQMVFGELVPKNLAISRPLEVARAVAGTQRLFTKVTLPLINVLNGAANKVLRLLGVEPQEELRSARSASELSSLVSRSAVQGTLAEDTAELVTRSLAFGGRTAADVMTPRVQVTFLKAAESVERVLAAAERTGHSRFPVAGDGVDDVVGVVHVKHALAVPADQWEHREVREVMVEPVLVPGSVELDPLLGMLRERGLQMAVVVDEYGGTDGVVTLEDLVEEIVGDIADEHDRVGAHARRRRDGSWSLSGLLRPDEVKELTGVDLPEDKDYDTIAGLVLDRFGRFPEVDERTEVETPRERVVLHVERMDGLRIARIGLRSLPKEEQ